jgi:D-alanyl-D-alanine carboxypeptidase/D-alanyl-D-alanine-endopeptidase (penicillin-binding protein 4)
LADSFFDTTQIAVDIYDLTLKESLYSKNEKFLMRPASNMKILTTSAALVYLSPSFNFNTKLCYTGEIKEGALNGDLYVIGGCDPLFSIKDLDSLAVVLKSAGINEVKGNLVGDVSLMDSLSWGKGWMRDDDCAYLTPLDVNENSIGVLVKPGILGEKASVQLIPETNFVEINNYSLTVPSDSPNAFALNKDWLHCKNILTLTGKVSGKAIADSLQDTLHINVYEPQLYFLSLFQDALKRGGISISGQKYIADLPTSSHELFIYKRPFIDMINYINKESYNLGAEMTLRALADKYFGKPATAENGIKMIDSLIALSGLNPKAFTLADGSGISHYNLVSARLILQVLKYIYYQKTNLYQVLYESFPVAGIDGTLSYRMKNGSAQKKVHAKTGTLSGVSCLSGYVTADNGHLLAFSILLQNFSGGSRESRDYEDKICNIMAEYK